MHNDRSQPTGPVIGRPGTIFTLLAIIAAGLGLRFYLLETDPFELIHSLVADDMFYYLQIARNVAAGQGATFDGLTVTNGFHPLYLLLLVPLFWLTGNPHLPLIIGIWGLQLVTLATTPALYLLVFRATGKRLAGLVAAGCWFLNPYSAKIAATGVEAPLAILFMVLAAERYLAWKEYPPSSGSGRAAVWGMLLGLAVLARTDQLITTTVIFGEAMVLVFLARRTARPLHGFWVAPLAWLAVTAPWWLWNLAWFGTIRQSSGSAIYYTSHEGVLRQAADPVMTSLNEMGRNLFLVFRDQGLVLAGVPSLALGLFFSSCLLSCCLWLYLRMPTARRPRIGVLKLGFFFVSAALLWLVYPLVFWQIRAWYFLVTVLAWAVLSGLAAAVLIGCLPAGFGRLGRAVFVIGPLLIALVCFAATAHQLKRRPLAPWQTIYYGAAQLIDKYPEIEPGETIGAFNAGILGYYANRPVVNLDGVTNNEILPVLKIRELDRYLENRGIRYLIDHEEYIWGYGMYAGPNYRPSLWLLYQYNTQPFAGDVVVVEVGRK